jgi:hypothetical protein
MYDVYNVSSLAKAAQANIIQVPEDAREKGIDSLALKIGSRYNIDEYMLSPARAVIGWKYVLKD